MCCTRIGIEKKSHTPEWLWSLTTIFFECNFPGGGWIFHLALQQILQKPFRLRDTTDIEELIEYTKNIPFFRDKLETGQEIHRNCCHYMKCEFIMKDQYVFHISNNCHFFMCQWKFDPLSPATPCHSDPNAFNQQIINTFCDTPWLKLLNGIAGLRMHWLAQTRLARNST